ncbi:serine hydrolase [Aegicerativicinus sediminis]
MKNFLIVLFQLAVIPFLTYAQVPNNFEKELDKLIQDGMKLWEVPGVELVVVKDGEVVYSKGFGVASIETKKPVDEHTLMVCASTTKAFTAAAMATLVDQGKLKWTDKVSDILPDFQLSDPYITKDINIIDLFTHQIGLPNSDYLWTMMEIPADSVLYRMREVPMSYSLRNGHVYQNIMYVVAGKIIEKLSGQDWGVYLKKHIYDPLGMDETYAYQSQTEGIVNKASAHDKVNNAVMVIPQSRADLIGPAGSMWSNIDDMGNWLKFLLNEGVVDGDTLISKKQFKKLFEPHHIIPESSFYSSQKFTKPHWRTYGLGWFQHDYKGEMVNFHTGSLSGMHAIAGLIPDKNIGVYYMANMDNSELRHSLMYAVFDLLLEGKVSRDWNNDIYNVYNPKDTKTKPDPKPIANAPATFNTEQLLGEYIHKKFGSIKVFKENGSLRFNLNDKLFGTLSHWHYDTYQLEYDRKDWGTVLVTFQRGENGELGNLLIFNDTFKLKKK